MLNEIRDFAACLYTLGERLFTPPVGNAQFPPPEDRFRMYCPDCGGLRRIKVEPVFWASGKHVPHQDPNREYWYWRALARGAVENADDLLPVTPSIFRLTCSDCESEFTAVCYPRQDGLKGVGLAVLPRKPAGIRTPHTPETVAYYLDQAARCMSVDAASAAAAMFRSAVEQFLLNQGFSKRMLGPKIAELEDAIHAGRAPQWVNRMDPYLLTETLEAIKTLANACLHGDGGQVSAQAELDAEILGAVQVAIAALLDAAYEAPERAKNQTKRLKASAAHIAAPPATT